MEYQNENFNGQYDFRSRSHDGWHMHANIHEYSELLYCKNGSGYVYINGSRLLIKERELVWIPPNYVHGYDFESAEVICAVFSNDFIPLFFKKLGNRYFCVSSVQMTEMSGILEALPMLNREDPLRISGYLNLICAKVMEEASFDDARCTDGVLYQKVVAYVSKNYMQDITLSLVAKEFGYNIKYLSHTLHTLTGIDFRQLVNFYRLNHAKSLLERPTEWNISTIAAESGFKALNTFNREFKKMTGMTPSGYKRIFM